MEVHWARRDCSRLWQSTVGYAQVSDPTVGGWINGWTKENIVNLAVLHCSALLLSQIKLKLKCFHECLWAHGEHTYMKSEDDGLAQLSLAGWGIESSSMLLRWLLGDTLEGLKISSRMGALFNKSFIILVLLWASYLSYIITTSNLTIFWMASYRQSPVMCQTLCLTAWLSLV